MSLFCHRAVSRPIAQINPIWRISRLSRPPIEGSEMDSPFLLMEQLLPVIVYIFTEHSELN
jgi:hypothetical protein